MQTYRESTRYDLEILDSISLVGHPVPLYSFFLLPLLYLCFLFVHRKKIYVRMNVSIYEWYIGVGLEDHPITLYPHTPVSIQIANSKTENLNADEDHSFWPPNNSTDLPSPSKLVAPVYLPLLHIHSIFTFTVAVGTAAFNLSIDWFQLSAVVDPSPIT